MPSVAESAFSVAANAKSAERLNNTDLQFVGPGRLEFYARASATGLNSTLTVDGVPITNDQVVTYTGTAGGLSTMDHLVDAVDIAGGKLQLFYRNTTGAAITVDYLLKFTPS